jgi:hypothetical protein
MITVAVPMPAPPGLHRHVNDQDLQLPCQCHFLLGDLTVAVEEAHLAVDAARSTRSGRVRAQLGELYPYTVGNSTARPVRAVRDRIRDLLSN